MKSRIKKMLILSAVGLFGIVGATAAFARHGAGAEHRMRFVEQLVSAKLDLNDAQKQKLSEVKQALLDAKQRRRAEWERDRDELERLLLDDTLDQAKLQEMLLAHQNRLTAEAPQVLAAVAELHRSLSQAQKEKAVQVLREFRRRHRH